jgi:GTP-binding protein HflX
VGFVSDLPTDLIAAFRATLEEVVEADIIVHVRDISHPDTLAQASDVEAVLKDLGLDRNGPRPIFEALNKIDLLDEDERAIQLNQTERRNDAVAISAITGEGCSALLNVLDASLNSARRVVAVAVDVTDGAAIAWLYRHGEVLNRNDDDQKAHIEVSLNAADLARFERRTNA